MFKKELLLFESGGRSNFRIPSVIATKKGTVLAFCNDRKDTLADHAEETTLDVAVKPLGEEWGAVKELVGLEGWACGIGAAVYDEEVGKAMCFFGRNPAAQKEFGGHTEAEIAEKKRLAEEKIKASGIKPGTYLAVTEDEGLTWTEQPVTVEPVEYTHYNGTVGKLGGSTHGSAHGIQLRHGKHKGRLLCPSRTSIGSYTTWDELRKCVYNNSIYSDDHGKTWKASTPVQLGTGEGTLIENQDGTITYNSRAYFQDQKRYLATSTDGGETYGDFRTDDFLIEEKNIGCNASFLRVEKCDLKHPELLPADADSITVFANPRAESRRNMTLCVSFDSGKTYAKTKTVWEGPAAYSSLAFNVADQTFYLLYEKGSEGQQNPYQQGISMVEFDLEWLLFE